MAVDFGKRLKEAEDAGLVAGSDYFKLKEGDNRFRLMSECLAHPGEYKGERNFKWLCYVIDRRDAKVKPFFMAHSVYKQIAALQTNEEYAFSRCPDALRPDAEREGCRDKRSGLHAAPGAEGNTNHGVGVAGIRRNEVPIGTAEKAAREEGGSLTARRTRTTATITVGRSTPTRSHFEVL
jgi:hypothetical protein